MASARLCRKTPEADFLVVISRKRRIKSGSKTDGGENHAETSFDCVSFAGRVVFSLFKPEHRGPQKFSSVQLLIAHTDAGFFRENR
jgi:hypothetical protein